MNLTGWLQVRRDQGSAPPSGAPSWRADMAGRGVGSGPRAAGLAVYVGATLADVQPMLAADLGVLVAPDPEVLEALKLLGVRVGVLTTGAQTGEFRLL